MKLQLVYEEPYAGYGDADAVKSPSPVPRTVRGGVDLSVFNNGTTPIKVRWLKMMSAAACEPHASIFDIHDACMQVLLCAGHLLLPMHVSLLLILSAVQVDSLSGLSEPFIIVLSFAQVPWTLMIVMPPNEKFVTVFNARLTNTSADGVSSMVVSDEWQTLQANRANAADVSFLVDASSQARLWMVLRGFRHTCLVKGVAWIGGAYSVSTPRWT